MSLFLETEHSRRRRYRAIIAASVAKSAREEAAANPSFVAPSQKGANRDEGAVMRRRTDEPLI